MESSSTLKVRVGRVMLIPSSSSQPYLTVLLSLHSILLASFCLASSSHACLLITHTKSESVKEFRIPVKKWSSESTTRKENKDRSHNWQRENPKERVYTSQRWYDQSLRHLSFKQNPK